MDKTIDSDSVIIHIMEGLKNFLASRNISASDVGKAVVIHEVLGVSVMVSAWAVCWAVKPSKHIINALQLRKTSQWKQAQEETDL